MPSPEWSNKRPDKEGCYFFRAAWCKPTELGHPCRVIRKGHGFVIHVDGYRPQPLSAVHHKHMLWRKADA